LFDGFRSNSLGLLLFSGNREGLWGNLGESRVSLGPTQGHYHKLAPGRYYPFASHGLSSWQFF
jgi:hypothetical protein